MSAFALSDCFGWYVAGDGYADEDESGAGEQVGGEGFVEGCGAEGD